METPRQEIERREEAALAPYALRSRLARRPRVVDPEGRLFDYRTEYQRDRDRILHARAFRRLRLKAEGGAAGPVERRRDRLTHTLETAQLARTIARALALNEDLAEAIALGHALGSPPYGRDGARAMDEILRAVRLPGGFARHAQSLRVVDLLEKRYEHPGLNLTHDVRAGIYKQGSGAAPPPPGRSAPSRRAARRPAEPARTAGVRGGSLLDGLDLAELDPAGPASLEAQSVAVADRIAGSLGDLDDALRASEIEPGFVEALPLVRELLRRVGDRYPRSASGRRFMKANVLHRGLTHLLVTATIHGARRTLRAWCREHGVETHESFLDARATLPPRALAPSPRTERLFEGLQEALDARLHAAAASAQAASRARQILGGLFAAYRRDPRLLDDYALLRFREIAGGPFLRDLPAAAMETEIARRYHDSRLFLRVIGDHVAGMTDAYAQSEYGRLHGLPATGGEGRALP